MVREEREQEQQQDGKCADESKTMRSPNANKDIVKRKSQCVVTHKAGSFIPYRNSKLTFLLKNSLGGNSKTIMIATLRTDTQNARTEALMSLKYASRARHIRNHAAINTDCKGTGVINVAYSDFERLQRTLWERTATLAGLRREQEM